MSGKMRWDCFLKNKKKDVLQKSKDLQTIVAARQLVSQKQICICLARMPITETLFSCVQNISLQFPEGHGLNKVVAKFFIFPKNFIFWKRHLSISQLWNKVGSFVEHLNASICVMYWIICIFHMCNWVRLQH